MKQEQTVKQLKGFPFFIIFSQFSPFDVLNLAQVHYFTSIKKLLKQVYTIQKRISFIYQCAIRFS